MAPEGERRHGFTGDYSREKSLLGVLVLSCKACGTEESSMDKSQVVLGLGTDDPLRGFL